MKHIGADSPGTAPWLWLPEGKSSFSDVGYANVVVVTDPTVNLIVGSPAYWEPNTTGNLSIFNVGTLDGAILVTGNNSNVTITGPGIFDGAITWPSSLHFGGGSGYLGTNLGSNAVLNIGNFPEFGSASVELNGPAAPGATINVNCGHLQLDQFNALPDVFIGGPFASVTYSDVFSDNLAATLSNNTLTIQDFGLHRTLTEHVSGFADPLFNTTAKDWVLDEPSHASGQHFTGLTLTLNPTSGDTVIHPIT